MDIGVCVRIFYTLLMYSLLPYFLGRLCWKGRQLPGYRQRIAERFGYAFGGSQPVDIWVHTVSLGEVIAATPLIEALLAEHFTLLVTTMTPTGSDRVMRYFGSKVTHQYLPYDLPGAIKRFFNHYQPRLGLIMETELWPNLIAGAQKRGLPVMLVNGRLSPKSYQGYAYGGRLFAPLLKKFHAILVQTPEDRDRFLQLGASPASVQVLGNMKFDVTLTKPALGRFESMKQAWGASRPVLMLASTHADEEQQVLTQLPVLKQALPAVVLLVAPRHPERFDAVYQLCVQAGFKTGRGSQSQALTPAVDIVVLDSLGELMQAYQCADYAFVGGSLAPVGGHNVLEPIAMGTPVFSGPNVHNFQSICQSLQAAGAMQLVESAAQLVQGVIALYKHDDKKYQQVAAATRVLMENRGSLQRYMAVILQILGVDTKHQ